MNKRGIEMSFAVLFSIIVGAVILFLAIFSAMKIVNRGGQESASIATKQLTILFEPMETGIASGIAKPVNLKEEVRIYNECFNDNYFGSQRFSVSSQIFNQWQKKNEGQKISNKYVYSDAIEEGKKAYLFSKPFEFPYKVSELIYFSTENYCFSNAPEFVIDEIQSMEIKNIKLNNCSVKDVKVCFGTTANCNIIVRGDGDDYEGYEYGMITKNNKTILFYSPALMYAGIFSSPEIYQCNFKRLMKRASSQASLFSEESYYLTEKCGAINSQDMARYSSSLSSIQNINDLRTAIEQSKRINDANQGANCELW